MNAVSAKSCAHTFVVVPILLAAGCGASVPTHYHTLLDPVRESTPASAAKFMIDLEPVGIPAQVDQPQLLVRSDDDSLRLLEHERWIAPLADESRAALSADLAHNLNTVDIAGLPSSSPLPTLRIKVELHRFESAPGRYAALDATWSLAFANTQRQALECASHLQESIGPGYIDLVRGLRQTMALLASQISLAAQKYAAGGPSACPMD
jgi:uncharacterized lipoprotein YmbA